MIGEVPGRSNTLPPLSSSDTPSLLSGRFVLLLCHAMRGSVVFLLKYPRR